MLTHLLISLLATAAVGLVLPRDAATIQNALQTINADYIALAQADKAYSTNGALPIQTAVTKTDTDTNLASTDAVASSPLSEADSKTIIDYINHTLEPNIEAAIHATEANKAQVAAAGLTGVVKSELVMLKNDTDALGSALECIVPADEVYRMKAAFAKIEIDYNGGIAAFSS